MVGLQKFVLYSSLLHTALFATTLIQQFSKTTSKDYYSVDFYEGGFSGGGAKTSPINLAAEEKLAPLDNVEKSVVNPKEDLLIKSKDKKSKIKEKVVTEPSIPIPKASPLKQKTSGDSDGTSSSAIPGTSNNGSGVGVGFGPDGWGGSGGAGNFPYQWYVHAVKKKLDANWNVTGGFSKRIYAQIAFTIARNGTIMVVEVEESSGNEVFDYQARRAVVASGPLPPLPKEYQEPSLRVHVRFTVKN